MKIQFNKPDGVKMVGGTVGGALAGLAIAGPSGAVAGGFLGLVIGSANSDKKHFL